MNERYFIEIQNICRVFGKFFEPFPYFGLAKYVIAAVFIV